jgi:hypothetical protein
VDEDFEAIDTSNIITGGRGSRRAAQSSGLARKPERDKPKPAVASSSSSSSSSSSGPPVKISRIVVEDSEEEEADF